MRSSVATGCIAGHGAQESEDRGAAHQGPSRFDPLKGEFHDE